MAKMIDPVWITALWENGLMDEQIGEQMNRSDKSIKQWRQRHGMASNRDIFKWGRPEHEHDKNQAIREVR